MCKLTKAISSYIKKWLGLPHCQSNIGLYGHGALEVPVSSLIKEMTLTDSQDAAIRATGPRLATERKWTPSDAVQQTVLAVRHGDIVGQVWQGRGVLGLGASHPTKHKATSIERGRLVVAENRQQKEAERCA